MSFKPNLSVTLTAEQERLWSNAIGGVMLNFGQVEFTSHRWIQHFARDPLIEISPLTCNFQSAFNLFGSFWRGQSYLQKFAVGRLSCGRRPENSQRRATGLRITPWFSRPVQTGN